MTSSTAVITQELEAALSRLASQTSVLICLDFDGCVAELVADAYAARPVPENQEAINRIAGLDDAGITMAYVSGRPLADLHRQAFPPDGTVLIGSHGAEKYFGPDSPGLELTATQDAARTEVLEALEQLAADYEGAWVEYKPAGGAIHARHIEDADLAEAMLQQARTVLSEIDGAEAKEGKQIIEAVVLRSTKGEAITELREKYAPDAVFFTGDDVTDEHGFAVLEPGDVGVKVGEGLTQAGHRIAAPGQLAAVLNCFADLRSG